MLPNDTLASWLRTVLDQADGRYWYRLLVEERDQRPTVLDSLREYAAAAHADALRLYEDIVRPSLDPVESAAQVAREFYPSRLHPTTQMSYLGEVLAGLVIEALGAFALEGWRVPVWFFRFDEDAIRQLESLRLLGVAPRHLPGHHGPDVVALLRAENGRVTHGLICEAKCHETFRSDAASEAHSQLSNRFPLAADIWRVSYVLKDDPDDSQQWQASLAQLSVERSSYEELDMVCYTCGRGPIRGGRQTWLAHDHASPEYTSTRKLQVAEIHLRGADELVREVYRASEDANE